jgi:hypothetical protein
VEREIPLTENGAQPRDHFYHGVVSKIYWSNETGVIRSDSGRDIPFVFAFVTLLGAPRQDINFLRPGMRVGFDVGWTSKGLRASVIKIYDLFEETTAPEPSETPESLSGQRRREEIAGHPPDRQRSLEAYGVPDPTRYRQRRQRPQSRPQKRTPQQPHSERDETGSQESKKS